MGSRQTAYRARPQTAELERRPSASVTRRLCPCVTRWLCPCVTRRLCPCVTRRLAVLLCHQTAVPLCHETAVHVVHTGVLDLHQMAESTQIHMNKFRRRQDRRVFSLAPNFLPCRHLHDDVSHSVPPHNSHILQTNPE